MAVDEPEIGKAATDKGGKSKRLWVWVGVLIGLAVVGVGAWEFTSSPSFCGSCHEIAPSVQGWRESAHADKAKCMDCHSEAGFVGEALTHLGGVQEAYMHLTEKPQQSDIHGFVPSERCLACHEKDWDKLPAAHPRKDAHCGVCHRGTAHTNDKPLYLQTKGGN